MVEYDKLIGEESTWRELMERTKNLRDRIWGDDELEDREDG